MSAAAPPDGPPPEIPPIAPDDLAKLLAASAVFPGTSPEALPDERRGLKRKLLVAVLIAVVGVGASIMSCVGQSFSYRQARAMEGIEHQLKEIRAGCSVSPGSASPR